MVLVDKKTVVTIDNVKFCDSGQSLILLSGATLNPFSESPNIKKLGTLLLHACRLHRHPDQLAHADRIEHAEGIVRQDALLDVER